MLYGFTSLDASNDYNSAWGMANTVLGDRAHEENGNSFFAVLAQHLLDKRDILSDWQDISNYLHVKKPGGTAWQAEIGLLTRNSGCSF